MEEFCAQRIPENKGMFEVIKILIMGSTHLVRCERAVMLG